jgi:ATP-dependent helicase/nuclease subunit A
MKPPPQTHIRIISAGAGSGKTFRLTSEMVDLLQKGVRPSGIIATTFTKKAAAELQERVRVRLLESGLTRQADELTNALIGTVHSLGVKLLQRFAFEAGVSPRVEIIAEEDQQTLFNNSLAMVLRAERVEAIDRLCHRLGMHHRAPHDWRKELRELTDIARSNAFSLETLAESKTYSWESFARYLPAPTQESEEALHIRFAGALDAAIARVENNGDATKKTADAVTVWRDARRELLLDGSLAWRAWMKIAKTDVAVKSRDDAAPLIEAAREHEANAAFQNDIRDYIFHIFEAATDALQEYERYKKQRGLIDYTDMETLILRLLDKPEVRDILSQELDLLMVDEFQDTNPIQLEIFLKLSRMAAHSVWVGDPKQSIYGFRGADPRLMQAIVDQSGGIRAEDIQRYSWRSRQGLVYAANALFTKAFPELPADQVALEPKRSKATDAPGLTDALWHWHFRAEGETGRPPGAPWMENCIAERLREWLDTGVQIWDKEAGSARPARPGDVAILCRSNKECATVAEALHRAGLRAAIARNGLLATAEARLVTACLKFVLNYRDSLSIAEILLLAGGIDIEDIIENRLDYLEQVEQNRAEGLWSKDHPVINRLLRLRKELAECSGAEILDVLLDELDLRRIIAAWGNAQQRLDNIEALRRLALQYEDACTRLHTAASLGGFLLWLSDLENNEKDMQASGQGPDTVEVLTYHKSKGLEWPVTICHSLEQRLRADVWGFDIVPQQEAVDLDNLLGNRLLRFWVNPYGDQALNTPLDERLKAGPEKAAVTARALREEARLLYVGLTRARDYLIFPTVNRPPKWLNRVWHAGVEDYPVLDPNSEETPWEWAGMPLTVRTEMLAYPRDFTYAELREGVVTYLEPRKGRAVYPPAFIDVRRENINATVKANAGKPVCYGAEIALPADADRYAAAKGIKAFLNAYHAALPAEEHTKMAKYSIARFCPDSGLTELRLLQAGQSWTGYLGQRFTIKSMHRKYPVMLEQNGRLFYAVLDLVLETDAGMVLIQNSSFDSDHNNVKWGQRATELAGWLHLAGASLRTAFKKPLAGTFVHFVLSAVLVEVETA